MVAGVALVRFVVEKSCPVEVLGMPLSHGKFQKWWQGWLRYHMWCKKHDQSKSRACRLPTVSSNSGGSSGIGLLAGVALVPYVVEESCPVEVLGGRDGIG